MARTSAFHFKDSPTSIAEIGKSLHVAYVLEGSVRESGGRLRITAQLIRAADERHVMSRTYERPADDIFKLQDEIAGEVLTVLRVALADVPRIHSATTWDAYQTYLEGRFSDTSLAEEDKAIAAFRSALAIDAHFAPAWAALADTLTDKADSHGEDPTRIYAEARRAAQRALDLDPNLVDGYLAMAYILAAHDYDLDGAAKLAQQAAGLEPSNARVMRELALNARFRGDWDTAVAFGRRAVARDPLSAGAHVSVAVPLHCGGRLDEADAEYRRSFELDPKGGITRSMAALNLAQQKRFDEALQMARQDPNEAYSLWSIAQVQSLMGRAADSDASLALYRKRYPHGNDDGVAWIYAVQGKLDAAFEWFDKAYVQRNQGLMFLKCMPEAPAFTRDPRYKTLLRKMNLPD